VPPGGAGDKKESRMVGAAVEVTDANFAELTGKGVALVDFWGPHCPPCRVQGPIVDKVATQFDGRATVGKLDVESNPRAPTEFGLMYIPTLIIFRDGKEWKRFTGLQQEGALVLELEDALKEA
jgi:thioredoxin 1